MGWVAQASALVALESEFVFGFEVNQRPAVANCGRRRRRLSDLEFSLVKWHVAVFEREVDFRPIEGVAVQAQAYPLPPSLQRLVEGENGKQ